MAFDVADVFFYSWEANICIQLNFFFQKLGRSYRFTKYIKISISMLIL